MAGRMRQKKPEPKRRITEYLCHGPRKGYYWEESNFTNWRHDNRVRAVDFYDESVASLIASLQEWEDEYPGICIEREVVREYYNDMVIYYWLYRERDETDTEYDARMAVQEQATLAAQIKEFKELERLEKKYRK
jgi:hypothetical protein